MEENKEELSIEEMFDRLDGIMRTLEDSRSTLEESFASYEAGMRLVRACSEKIDKVEKQIMVVNARRRRRDRDGKCKGTAAQAVKEAEEIVYSYLPAEEGHQKTIFEAMNYSVKAGGKRLRPILMREVYRLFGGQGKEIEPLMAAIEMIHTSSLIHDDLPCMDNDEYRRGKKTTWVAYGYDMAVLAGDALLIYAIETAAKAFAMTPDAAKVGRCIQILSEKTGIYGMIGGQTVDVELTNQPIPKDKLDFIYRLKTGALLEASMVIGA